MHNTTSPHNNSSIANSIVLRLDIMFSSDGRRNIFWT